MKRAKSYNDIINTKVPQYEFTGDFNDAFGIPDANGAWFIWGNSGSGKTRFSLQLAKYMTAFGQVLFDSLEEGITSSTLKNGLRSVNMASTGKRFLVVKETIPELIERLDKRRSPRIVIIDSIQYADLNAKSLKALIERYESSKLIIFISQADKGKPLGAVALKAQYAASLKIWVEGYRAYSNGRYYGQKGFYTIWREKAAEYWMDGKS